MIRTFGWAVLFLCVLGGIGYYLDWFSVSASLNKGKIKDDVNSAKDKVHGLLGDRTIEGTIHQIAAASQELTVLDSAKQAVTVKVDAVTKIRIGEKDSSFKDLKTDDPVSVSYEASKDGNTARTITVSKKS